MPRLTPDEQLQREVSQSQPHHPKSSQRTPSSSRRKKQHRSLTIESDDSICGDHLTSTPSRSSRARKRAATGFDPNAYVAYNLNGEPEGQDEGWTGIATQDDGNEDEDEDEDEESGTGCEKRKRKDERKDERRAARRSSIRSLSKCHQQSSTTSNGHRDSEVTVEVDREFGRNTVVFSDEIEESEGPSQVTNGTVSSKGAQKAGLHGKLDRVKLQSILKNAIQDKKEKPKDKAVVQDQNRGYESDVRPTPSEQSQGQIKGQGRKQTANETQKKVIDLPGKSVPALPVGYKPQGKRMWQCPVEGCEKDYIRRDSLGGHMNTAHGQQTLYDNEDGTLSIVPAVPKSSSTRPRRNTLPRPQNGAMETTASELLAAVNNAARVVAHIQKSIAPAPSPSLVPAAQPKQNAANEEDAVTSDENRRHQKEKLKKSKIHTRSLSLNEAGANGIGNGAENGSAIQNSDNATQNNTAEPVTPEHRSKKRKRSSRASENKDSAPMEFNMRPAGILEDWEFTPGVLKVPGSQNNSGNTLTIAYSAPHIRVSNGVTLGQINHKLHEVISGSSLQFSAAPFATTFFVASGKVQVIVGAEQKKEFAIGTQGLWLVRAGEECVIGNWGYESAVVLVSAGKM